MIGLTQPTRVCGTRGRLVDIFATISAKSQTRSQKLSKLGRIARVLVILLTKTLRIRHKIGKLVKFILLIFLNRESIFDLTDIPDKIYRTYKICYKNRRPTF